MRVQIRIEVRDVETGCNHVLHTRDLSVGGARCTGMRPVRESALLQGHLFLPLSEAGRDVDVAVPVRGRVVRVDSSSVGSCEFGLMFDAMSEADRAELSAYLFDWLAHDSCTHAHLVAEAI